MTFGTFFLKCVVKMSKNRYNAFKPNHSIRWPQSPIVEDRLRKSCNDRKNHWSIPRNLLRRFLFFTEVEETTETPIKIDPGGLKLWCINTKTCLASIETGEAPMWISAERFTSFLELDTTKSYNITNSTLKMTSFWRSFSSWNTWFSYATN